MKYPAQLRDHGIQVPLVEIRSVAVYYYSSRPRVDNTLVLAYFLAVQY